MKRPEIHSKKELHNLSADDALSFLKEGNKLFLEGVRPNYDFLKRSQEVASGQFPVAAVLSCIDSRSIPEFIFSLNIGDIFTVRTPGHVIGEEVLAGLEFATAVTGVKVIVILGHSDCGMMKGVIDGGVHIGVLEKVIEKTKPVLEMEKEESSDRTSANRDFVNQIVTLNTDFSLNQIRSGSPVIYDLEKSGTIKIVKAFHDIASGKVTFFD